MVITFIIVAASTNVQVICSQSIIKHASYAPKNSLIVPPAFRIAALHAHMVNLLITHAYLVLLAHLMSVDRVAHALPSVQPVNLKLAVQLASAITIY